MKKLLSMLLSVCMLGAFAVSAAQAPTEYTVNFVENETTVDAKIVCKGTMEDVAQFNVWIKYNTEKLSFASEKLCDTIETYKTQGKWNTETKTAAGYQRFNWSNVANPASYVSGENLEIATLTFNKLASIAEADIAVGASVKPAGARKAVNTGIQLSTDTDIVALSFSSSFTPYVPAGKDPVITVDESAKTGANNGVINVVTGTEGNYSVTVKAPIGKTPVLVVGGENIPMTSVGGADYSYAGQVSADATIKVIYEDDATSVITYPIVYQDTECAVVFGKGTIAEGDKYGIKVTDTTGASKEKEATFNASGIFGIRFNYVNANGETADNGDYKAQAFVNDVYGAEITFTK